MKLVFVFLNWIFGVLFFLLFLLSLFSRHFLPSILILIIIILLTPPIRQWIIRVLKIPLPVWLRSLLIPILIFLFIYLIFSVMGNKYSIYKNLEIEKELMTIYDKQMNKWPVHYENRYIDTDYGKVYVIISGPENAPPVLLLHASAMASWSWLYNVKELSKYYRIYAIDTIGDAGRSKLKNIESFPGDGRMLSVFYKDIMDKLGIKNTYIIGASQGGFITTNIAFYAPERVKKIILSGPMGYTGTTQSVLRILFTTMFPVKPIQSSTFHWAFGNDPLINKEVGEWFNLILEGVISRQARPQSFTSQQLSDLKIPVLLILGERDGLVGNPENAKKLVKEFKNFTVKTLDTGHLINAERPHEFNKMVIDFFQE